MWSIQGSGIDEGALRRYIDEQIYTLPGTDAHRDVFTVLLTGSRATGTHAGESDVDIDVLCPEQVYRSVHAASLEAGIIRSRTSFFCPLAGVAEDWGRYFGEDKGAPHFSLNTLEGVRDQFEEYTDPALWIWTNAKIIADPNGQFQRIRDTFTGYPKDVLVRKIKYHWLMCWYWAIDVYPHHHRSDDEMVVAAAAVINAILEMRKVFFLVEGKPIPYTGKLPVLSGLTELGRRFDPLLNRWVDMVVGKTGAEIPAWDRLDAAIGRMLDDGGNEETRALEEACVAAIITAGVDEAWMRNYYSNIDELLCGELGPAP